MNGYFTAVLRTMEFVSCIFRLIVKITSPFTNCLQRLKFWNYFLFYIEKSVFKRIINEMKDYFLNNDIKIMIWIRN